MLQFVHPGALVESYGKPAGACWVSRCAVGWEYSRVCQDGRFDPGQKHIFKKI